MSKTKPLKDVLKNASNVTSLSSSDRIMTIGSDGTPKRATMNTLNNVATFSCNANTWYRIVTTVGNLSTIGQLLMVSSPPEQECFSVKWSIPRTSYFSKSLIDIFNPKQSFSFVVMPKIRICRPSSSGFELHIDVFFAQGKTITVRLDPCLNANINIIENPPTVGLTVFEYDLNIFGGG